MHSGTAAPRPGDPYLLIVDDEPGVLEVARLMAATLGWNPVLANSAEHALALVRDHVRELDHVLVDLHLRGSSGLELARGLRKLNPDLHLAVMTGDDVPAGRPLGEPGLVDAVLVKPFTVTDLDLVFAPLSRARAA